MLYISGLNRNMDPDKFSSLTEYYIQFIVFGSATKETDSRNSVYT